MLNSVLGKNDVVSGISAASYTWHLSLRVDRPIEGCTLRPHAYMYSKKMDLSETSKMNSSNSLSNYESLTSGFKSMMRSVPPAHEFHYRWLRGPRKEPCAYVQCPRRTSFSPHDWSKYALKGGCSIQCVSQRSSLYRAIFCNTTCFKSAWKHQVTTSSASGRGNRELSLSSDMDNMSVASSGSGASSPTIKSYSNNISNSASSNFLNDYDENTEWEEISDSFMYVPTENDVGRKLKLEAVAVSLETGEALMSRVVKTDIVLSRTPPPKKMNLVTVKGAGGGGGSRFRIVTYNVLAEIYATQQQYPYCDFWALSWEYRFHNILRELMDCGGDVICLQEVQADHYDNYIYLALNDLGYEGVYKSKTRQAMGMAGKVDGCAIFWKRSKFHLIESYSIEFNELAQRQCQVLGMNPNSKEGSTYLNRLMRDNIAQLVVLELIQQVPSRSRTESHKQLCVANTHLYSHKDFPDVKLWQVWQLLQELESFVMSRGSNVPLILCGDLNSTPDTAAYDLLSRQVVHPGHPDVTLKNGDDSIPRVLPDTRSLTHSFNFGSAYASVMGKEPPYTNYTANFKGVLDYIWYSAQYLRPLSTVPIPDEDELTKFGEGLPSTMHSSDHIMLVADMQLGGRGS